MIVRTYARRNRCINSSYSDSGLNDGVDECSREPLSQESSQEIYSLPFSSQDSSHWAFDSDFGGSNPSQASLSVLPPRVPAGDSSSQGNGGSPNRKFKKPRCITQEAEETEDTQFLISKGVRSLSLPSTSTLMEAQEFGEMMEHVDEVNFALDGLRKGQPYRIRRASLLSLLSICATAQQRRLLRTQGMAKTIIDAILALSFDDSASTLAAAALFYILASDGQDEQLLASPICIHFLLKLLKPPAPDNTVKKMPTISSKLLALRKDPGILRDPSGKLDSSSTAIISKVQEILVSCKEMKSNNVQGEDGLGRPELSPKWVALLTMEKACLTTISLEDTSDTMRRVGGDFKEKLRELGGLDAIFDVVLNCHSIMKGWLEHSSPSTWELKDGVALQSVVLLLKCLKIMENATFLSKDNQNYLLGMNAELNHEASNVSFVGLILSVINILSGLSLLQHSSFISNSDGTGHDSEIPLIDDEKVDQYSDLSSNSSRRCYSLKASHVNGFEVSRKRPSLSTSQTSFSVSSVETSSYNRTSRSSKINVGLSKRANFTETIKDESLEENEDPFAFDEDELELSKWELLSMRKTVSRTQKGRVPSKKVESGGEHELVTIHPTSSNGENLLSCEISSSAVEQENSNLLPDCLLTAVKVLMNLTNDNPVGCQQIGACGGLETMSTLIIGHFPSFSSCLCSSSEVKDNLFSESITELHNQKGGHLTDQELDFLVAILGLLVNMVEKDSQNRSRLAAASVSLPSSGGLQGKESHKDVIPLLCSIFLFNQGSGEAAEEAKVLPWNDDDDVVLQGEREAEKMIIEAYAALLLAFLSTESKKTRDAISSYLPDHNLKVLVPVLERFVEFHLTLNMISPETHTAVSEVIESCRVP